MWLVLVSWVWFRWLRIVTGLKLVKGELKVAFTSGKVPAVMFVVESQWLDGFAVRWCRVIAKCLANALQPVGEV